MYIELKEKVLVKHAGKKCYIDNVSEFGVKPNGEHYFWARLVCDEDMTEVLINMKDLRFSKKNKHLLLNVIENAVANYDKKRRGFGMFVKLAKECQDGINGA